MLFDKPENYQANQIYHNAWQHIKSNGNHVDPANLDQHIRDWTQSDREPHSIRDARQRSLERYCRLRYQQSLDGETEPVTEEQVIDLLTMDRESGILVSEAIGDFPLLLKKGV